MKSKYRIIPSNREIPAEVECHNAKVTQGGELVLFNVALDGNEELVAAFKMWESCVTLATHKRPNKP